LKKHKKQRKKHERDFEEPQALEKGSVRKPGRATDRLEAEDRRIHHPRYCRRLAVNGVAALAELAKTDVAAYCKLAAGLIPKEFNLALASPMPGGLEPDDWALALEVFSAIKASLPDAADRRPGEVLEFVSGAIRAAGAKQLIELEPDANTMARADSEMLRGDSE
jgi:hypothetical protein